MCVKYMNNVLRHMVRRRSFFFTVPRCQGAKPSRDAKWEFVPLSQIVLQILLDLLELMGRIEDRFE